MKVDPTRTKTLVRSAEKAFSAPIERFWIRMKPILTTIIERNRSLTTDNKGDKVEWVNQSIVSEIEQILLFHDEATLRKELKRVTQKYISTFYRKSGFKAEAELRRLNIDYHWGLTKADVEAINILADNGFSLMKKSTEAMRSDYLRIISNGMLQGQGIPTMVKEMRGATNQAKYKAVRIARTETLNAYNQAALNQYKKVGIKKWRWLTAIDERTCPECEPLDNLVFTMDDPRPPKHPNCRCAVAAVVEEGKEKIKPEKATPPASLAACKTLTDMERYCTQKWPSVKWDFKNAHVDTIRPTIEQWAKLSKMHPEIVPQIKYIGTYRGIDIRGGDSYQIMPFESNVFAHAAHHRLTDACWIGLNSKYYGDPTKFKEALWRAKVSGWNPAGCDSIESIFTHEFGHQYYNYLLRINPNKAFYKYVGPDGYGSFGGTVSLFVEKIKATESLSRYALENIKEAFAEGFAAFHHGTASVQKHPYVVSLRRLIEVTKEKSYAKNEWKWSTDLDYDSPEWNDYMAWKDNMKKYLGF